jgi:hypothetical protein
MEDDHRSTGAGRHAASGARRGRRAPVLLAVATAIGVWLGISAPELSPVSAPVPVDQTSPVVPAPPAPGPDR